MHIPPYHRKRSWQVFAIGLFVGIIIAYIIFIFMYGKLYGSALTELTELQAEVIDLERKNEILLHDKELLQREQQLTIQEIDIYFINDKQFRFDRLTIHQLKSLIKKELQDMIGKEVKSIANHHTLMTNLIEKREFSIDDLSYSFTVEKLIITERVEIYLHISFAS